MTFIQLLYLDTVCRKGNSISAAATELDVTQSALKKAFRRLEEELNVTIFIKNGGKFFLTDEGEMLLAEARKVLTQVKGLEQTLAEYKQRDRRSLFGIDTLASETVKKLTGSEGRLKLSLTCEENGDLLRDWLESGAIDMCVLSTSRYKPEGAKIRCLPLFSLTQRFCTYYDHPYAHEQVVTSKMLTGERLVVFKNSGLSLKPDDLPRYLPQGVTPLLVTNQIDSVRYLLLERQCSTVIYPEALGSYPEIISVPFADAMTETYSFCYREKKGRTPYEKDLIDFFSKCSADAAGHIRRPAVVS